jgi:hypothetical protein
MSFAAQLEPHLASNWRAVRYESLMADFGEELRAICAFLGLDWVEGMDDFAPRARKREHATPSTAQLARGLDRSGIEHWKHYAAPLEAVMSTLNPWVERLGYAATSTAKTSE